jgi:hypothetical protein
MTRPSDNDNDDGDCGADTTAADKIFWIFNFFSSASTGGVRPCWDRLAPWPLWTAFVSLWRQEKKIGFVGV